MIQIRTWLLNQFERTKQIDLWPFFMDGEYGEYGLISTTRISEDFSSVLEICTSSPRCHQLPPGTNFNLTAQAAVLCCLMPHLCWLNRSDLLGQYTMSTARYGEALERTAYYLLQLPKYILVEILGGSDSQSNIFKTPTMRLICEVLPIFLARSPPATDLYFLVMLTSPVMRCLGIGNKLVFGRTDISRYTQKVSLQLASQAPIVP